MCAYLKEPQDVGHHDGDAAERRPDDACYGTSLTSLPGPTAGSTRG